MTRTGENNTTSVALGLERTGRIVSAAAILIAVPAFMGLAGEANWWAPSFLRQVHARYRLSETEPPAASPAPAT